MYKEEPARTNCDVLYTTSNLNSTQLKFIKTGSSKTEHTNNNLYRYSKTYVNIKYSTIEYSRITNTKKIKSITDVD